LGRCIIIRFVRIFGSQVLLSIDNDTFRFIKDLVKKSYPYECCGLLIGTNTSEKKVIEVRPVQNKNAERTHDRYEIEGKEFVVMSHPVSLIQQQYGLDTAILRHYTPRRP